MKNIYYPADTHVHSASSFDSSMSILSILREAENNDLKFITIADHVEFSNQPIKEVIKRIKDRNQKIDNIQAHTPIKIIKGIEVSEPHHFQNEMEYLKEIEDLDCIIGSIHHILGMPLSKMASYKNAYDLYFNSLLDMVENADIDCVAHLDRLKNIIVHGSINREIIEEILEIMISKHIALEINTGDYEHFGMTSPSEEIIELYHGLGGKNVTIGSDAHREHEIFNSIDNTENLVLTYKLNPGVIIKRRFRKI